VPAREDTSLSGEFHHVGASENVVSLRCREAYRPKLSGLKHEIEHLLTNGDIVGAAFKCQMLLQKVVNHKLGEQFVLDREVAPALADLRQFVKRIAEHSLPEACTLVNNLWHRVQTNYALFRDIKIVLCDLSLDVHMRNAMQKQDYMPSAIQEISKIIKLSAPSYNAYPFGEIFDNSCTQWAKLLYLATPKDRYEYAIDLHKWADSSMNDVQCLENFVGQILVEATTDEKGDRVILLDSEHNKERKATVTKIRSFRIVTPTSPEVK
jgi:hypothetical protein